MIKIAHITDLHITEDRGLANGVDVVKNFRKILVSVVENDIDSIVITGDLCFDVASKATMEWVKEELEGLSIPYRIIAGNHDDSEIMAEVFDMEDFLTGNELFFDEELEGSSIVYLDTSKGFMSEDQLSWLSIMNSILDENFLLFMHHPPVDASVFMDNNYALKGKEEVAKILTFCNNLKGVFCGHYHVDKVVDMQGIPVYITPSTYFQIDDKSAEFLISGYQIGWRKILWDGNILETEVVYC